MRIRKKSSAIGWRCGDIVRMAVRQRFRAYRKCRGLTQVDKIVQGRRINGQKSFLQIIAERAGIGIAHMRQLFRRLTAQQPTDSLFQR
jgi:transcriptional regulator with XRE-family HTH domain